MHELVIRGGLVATAFGALRCDIGIDGGRVITLSEHIPGGDQVIDAAGLFVLPGGVDAHCHIEEPRADGSRSEESFVSASRAAFAGGTTSVVSFIPQWKGHGVWERFVDYRERAASGMLDHAFHQIISDPTDAVMRNEVPRLVAEGVRSLKVFLTYEPLHLNDAQYIRVLETARELGCLVTVHCENYDAIKWRTQKLLQAGRTGPKYHAWSRPAVVEREATHRAIALAELLDQPIEIFHVSCEEAAEEIARAQARGIKVWGETCPQYLTLTAAHMGRPDGQLFMCSPAPRDADEHAKLCGKERHRFLRNPQRHSRPDGAAAADVQRGRDEGPDHPGGVLRPGRDEPGQADGAVPAQGRDRARQRRRPGAVGPDAAGEADQRPDAPRRGQHPL